MSTPFERAMKSILGVNAWKQADGLYKLFGDTYPIKERIKSFGGKWNPEKKYWLVSRECVDAVGALRMIRVKVAAHCHMPEREINVTHEEAESGVVRLGCGMCDTSFRCGDDVKILEILE